MACGASGSSVARRATRRSTVAICSASVKQASDPGANGARGPRINRKHEVDCGIDMGRLELGSEELSSLHKTIEAGMRGGVTGKRLGHGADAARPGVLQKIPFRAKPVPRVTRIGEIAFQNEGRAGFGFDAIDLVVLAAGKPRQRARPSLADVFRQLARQTQAGSRRSAVQLCSRATSAEIAAHDERRSSFPRRRGRPRTGCPDRTGFAASVPEIRASQGFPEGHR